MFKGFKHTRQAKPFCNTRLEKADKVKFFSHADKARTGRLAFSSWHPSSNKCKECKKNVDLRLS